MRLELEGRSFTAMILLVVLIVLGSCTARAEDSSPLSLTVDQVRLMHIAQSVGEGTELRGENFAKTAITILLNESEAGNCKRGRNGWIINLSGSTKAGEGDYSAWQVRLGAIRQILSKSPELGSFRTEDEMIFAVLDDPWLAAQISIRYFVWCYDMAGGNWRDAMLDYNRGPYHPEDGRDPNGYVNKSIKNIAVARKFIAGNYTVR